MKKRMIAWMLVLSSLIPMVFVSPVYAAESDSYMVPSYGIYQNFMEASFPDAFNNRLYLATLDACSDLNNLIDKASWVIGEDLSVGRCTEILANMVTLMNYQLEDTIVEQASVDTTKTLLDYGTDLAGIAAGGVGASSLKAGSDAVIKRITTAIGITNGALDFTANTIEDLELLVQLEGDYSMQYDFLETVYMYADIPEMKEAAQSLILANKEIMRYKLETITSVGESFAKFEATDVFLDQVAGELLEDPDFWGSDAYGPLMVLSAVYSKFSLFKLTLDIGLFLGDSLFGTSDIYNRYNEMFALRDIHNALLARVKANPALNEEDNENMDRNISLMKMALYVDARGEYCAYQLTTEGKLSELFSSANEENIEKNYYTSIDIIENTFASLDGLYVEEEWGINTPVNSKQLTQVSCIRDNGTSNQFNLTYNEDGSLATYTSDYYSSSGNNHYEYRYTYNQNGQLVQYQNVDNVYPERKNHYSEDGILTGWSYWEYDTFEYIRYCEYDSQGKLVREYADDGTYNTVYSYNELGLISYKTNSTIYGDMKGTGQNTYVYDSSGRLIEEISTSDWGFGEETSTLKYRYDYFPFVLVESYYDGSYSSSDLRYEDVSMLSIYLDETAKFEMTDGYLSKVVCEDCVYEFFYDGAFDDSFDEHIPDVKYEDEITGTYLAKYEDVQITIDADNSSEYFLTYTASGVTLEKIPLAYFNSNTSTEKMLMFIIDDYYPQYGGYVEVCWMKGSLFPYSYNAMIEDLDDTDGYYSDLAKTGVFIPAN